MLWHRVDVRPYVRPSVCPFVTKCTEDKRLNLEESILLQCACWQSSLYQFSGKSSTSSTFIFRIKYSEIHWYRFTTWQLKLEASVLARIWKSVRVARRSNLSQIVDILDLNFLDQTVEISLVLHLLKNCWQLRTAYNFGTRLEVDKKH